jgi:hypothetical protein
MKSSTLVAFARVLLLLAACVDSSVAEATRYRDQQQTDNNKPKFVSCRLALELDDWADDTAWEIRGPFPYIDVVMERDYDHYRKSDLVAFENFTLRVNETYSFILLDRAGNGIQGEDKKFAIYNVNNEVPILLKREKTDNIGEGRLFKFTVRETNATMIASPETSYKESSFLSSSEPTRLSLHSSATASIQQYVNWIRKSNFVPRS